MTSEVNLTKRARTPHGSRYSRVVLSSNGCVNPDLDILCRWRHSNLKSVLQ
jgi:hypothetical protein